MQARIILPVLIATATLAAHAANTGAPRTPEEIRRDGGTKAEISAAAEAEGLARTEVKGLDLAFKRPGADLSRYDSVQLDPIEVAFQKSWNPEPAGIPIRPEERQKIREELAKVLREEFAKVLTKSGRYKVVDAPAEGVLRVKAEIRDLAVNAPDVDRPGIVRSYTLSTGEMTLVADLRDAPTGQLLARVIDRRIDPDNVRMEWTTRLDNIAAAQRAAEIWAKILIRQLDAAHGAPK